MRAIISAIAFAAGLTLGTCRDALAAVALAMTIGAPDPGGLAVITIDAADPAAGLAYVELYVDKVLARRWAADHLEGGLFYHHATLAAGAQVCAQVGNRAGRVWVACQRVAP